MSQDILPSGYEAFLQSIKTRVQQAQLQALLAVNTELILSPPPRKTPGFSHGETRGVPFGVVGIGPRRRRAASTQKYCYFDMLAMLR